MRNEQRLDFVQLLRALAAIAVVFHHIPLFGNGAWGVDLIFVISGFIMCYVTEASGRHFFLERAIRVIPLYWAGRIGAFCIAAISPNLLKTTTADIGELLSSVTFIPFTKGGAVRPMWFLGWTRNYEVFFYVLFAIVLLISHRYRAYVAGGLLFVWFIVGRLVAFDGVILRFFTDPIILEFVFGMISYVIFMRLSTFRMNPQTVLLRRVLALAWWLVSQYSPQT